jgi:hypothetical protein
LGKPRSPDQHTPADRCQSPNQATDGRALRGSLARNVLADTTSGVRKGARPRGPAQDRRPCRLRARTATAGGDETQAGGSQDDGCDDLHHGSLPARSPGAYASAVQLARLPPAQELPISIHARPHLLIAELSGGGQVLTDGVDSVPVAAGEVERLLPARFEEPLCRPCAVASVPRRTPSPEPSRPRRRRRGVAHLGAPLPRPRQHPRERRRSPPRLRRAARRRPPRSSLAKGGPGSARG